MFSTSYGSTTDGNDGFDEQYHLAVPMRFSVEQDISLQPKSIPDSPFRPVGLLMDEGEGVQFVGDYAKTNSRQSSLGL